MTTETTFGVGKGIKVQRAPTGLIQKAPRDEMLDQRRVAAQPDEQRERLFTDRYGDLLAFAIHLTDHRRDVAEDLVQDAFVQFVLGRTRYEEIENIEAYLKNMLRYMNISRMNRSAQLLHDQSALSVADYDSCRLGWTAIEPPRRMQASEELHQICTYACSRKESSKAGSVLILRFFHDFFPTEIARILNSSRHSVDEWQRLARREVRLFMNKPGRLRFVNGKAPSARGQLKYLRPERDLMSELRQMIFNSRTGECLTQQELEEAYSENKVDALTTAKLAHIVSCRVCLDAVNSLLGLPLLEQRCQVDRDEPKEPPDDVSGGGGTSGGGSGDLPERFERRLRETREHKPQELRISVNGFLVSSLKVSSDLNELDLNLMPGDPIEFVEITSEQGVQLLFFSIDLHRSRTEEWATVELSEGRLLKASFQNEYGPSLHVVYKDPLPVAALVNAEENALSSPLFVVASASEKAKVVAQPDPERPGQEGGLVPAAGHEPGQAPLPDLSLTRRLRWSMQLLRSARSVLQRRFVAAESESTKNDLSEVVQSPFSTLFGQADRRRVWQHPGLLAVLISAVVVAAFLLFRTSLSPTVTATALLERAGAAEEITYQSRDKVRHRSIRFEERHAANGPLVAERKIETWENRAGGNRAQRLYDISNQLVAGAWQKPDGSRTVYHHGSRPQSQPAPATPESLLLNLENIWQLEPSAQTFRVLIGEPSLAQVSETSQTYLLTYEGVRTIGASRLLRATLVLSKTDLHPLEQGLLIERGGAIRDYRFIEAAFELLPVSAAAPAVFEIEPELTGGAGNGGLGDWALRDLTSSRVPPSPSTSAPPPASAELEVDVAYLLNLAKADRNEQVALTRSAGGSLRVEGVVESEQRRDEFLKILAPVRNNPAVKIEIRTIIEASRSVVVNPTVGATDLPEPTADTVAADKDLRAYFTAKHPGGPIEEEIRSYSSSIVNRGYKALFHAVELKQLVERFANVDMRTVAPDARSKWIKMLQEQARSFGRETAVLRREIGPVFFAGSPMQVADATAIQNDGELAHAVERLHQLAVGNNIAVRSALTISKQSSAVAIKSATFWQSLLKAEQLAEKIAQYQAP